MAKTRLDLANRALEKLFLVSLGQSPEAEDTAKVDAQIDSFREFIEGIEIYSIADLDDIDLAAFDWLAEYLAYYCATDFSKPRDEGKRMVAEAALKKLNSTDPTHEPLRVDYF